MIKSRLETCPTQTPFKDYLCRFDGYYPLVLSVMIYALL